MASNYLLLKSSELSLKKLFYEFFAHVLDMQNLLLTYMQSFYDQKEIKNQEIVDKLFLMEEKSNNFEAEILEECCWVISKDMPKANHLRFIIAILNSIKDLERMSDRIINIVNIYIDDHKKMSCTIQKILSKTWQESLQLTKKVYKALDEQKNLSYDQCMEVYNSWQEKNTATMKQIIDLFAKQTRFSLNQMQIFFVLRNVERCINHIINIAENFLYIYQSSFFFEKNNKKQR